MAEQVTNWFFDYHNIRHVETPGARFNDESDFKKSVILKYDLLKRGDKVTRVAKFNRHGVPTVNVNMPDVEAMKVELAKLRAQLDAMNTPAHPPIPPSFAELLFDAKQPQLQSPSIPPESETALEAGTQPIAPRTPDYRVISAPGIGWFNVVDEFGDMQAAKHMRKDDAVKLAAKLNGD